MVNIFESKERELVNKALDNCGFQSRLEIEIKMFMESEEFRPWIQDLIRGCIKRNIDKGLYPTILEEDEYCCELNPEIYKVVQDSLQEMQGVYDEV